MKRISRNQLEKWGIGITTVVVIYAAVIATLNFLNTPRIGYVNSAILLEKYPGAIAARDSLNAQLEKWNRNVKTLEEELNALNREMIARADKWDTKTLKEKKKALEKKQQDYLRYSRAVQEKAVKLEQELMQPVYDEINAYMKDFGKTYGYDMIFGTLAGGNILYAREAVDLTDDFLTYIQQKL